MTVLVAYDGQELSDAALERARSFADAVDQEVVAVSVVPNNPEYARDRGWIDDEESFAPARAIEHLRERVREVAPGARFRYELVDRTAPPGTIADRIRRVADHVDASVVFVGSEDAGGLVAPLSSVGGAVSASDDFDAYIVRNEEGIESDGDGPGVVEPEGAKERRSADPVGDYRDSHFDP